MRVFLDECVDWRLAREIVGHEVKTARQMGWVTIKNGELLALAGEHFDPGEYKDFYCCTSPRSGRATTQMCARARCDVRFYAFPAMNCFLARDVTVRTAQFQA